MHPRNGAESSQAIPFRSVVIRKTNRWLLFATRSLEPAIGCSANNGKMDIGSPNWKAIRSWRANTSCSWPSWAARIRTLPARRPGILWRSSFPRAAGPCIPADAPDISGSVKAYFALKLTGHEPQARSPCSGLGGRFSPTAGPTRSTASPAISWPCSDRFPTITVRSSRRRSCCCPKWFPVNLSAVSTWSRTIIVPLSIDLGLPAGTAARLPDKASANCFSRAPEDWPPLRCPGLAGGTGLLSWDRFFRTVDRRLKLVPAASISCLCAAAHPEAARQWMLERFAGRRRTGRDLPTDRLEPDRAVVPRLRATTVPR